MQKEIRKWGKHEHIHLKPSDTNVCVTVRLSNITLDYRRVQNTQKPSTLNVSLKGGNVRVLVPKEWYVRVKGKMSLSLLDNYTETYRQEHPHLILEIQSVGGKIVVINEVYT